MAQHDMNIANQGFPAFRSDLNSALSAIISNSSGATEPSTTVAYQFWADTTNDLLKQRNAANDGWVSILTLSTGEPVTGGTPDKIEEGNSSVEVVDSGTGYVSIVVDGAETARFISGGNFGIGTSSPFYNLTVGSGSGNAVLAAYSGATSEGQLVFADDSSGVGSYIGKVLYNHTDNRMSFVVNASERMRIDSSGNLNFNSGYGSVATAYGCRAWVNFNGTGTVAIRSSGNVSSITDTGAGRYIINFSTAMPDANYSICALPHNWSGSGGVNGPVAEISFHGGSTALQTGSAEIRISNRADTSGVDPYTVCASIFR